jgi:U2-associated protein SR140
VLAAWTEWGVYNATFMDELDARFEGKELNQDLDIDKESTETPEHEEKVGYTSPEKEVVIPNKPRGDWTEVADNENDNDMIDEPAHVEPNKSIANYCKMNDESASQQVTQNLCHGDPYPNNDAVRSQQDAYDDDVDGEPIDGEDGEDIDGEGVDGRPVEEDHMDGVSIEDKIDGKVEFDGDELDGEDLDGEDMDDEALDGEQLDGEEDSTEEQ